MLGAFLESLEDRERPLVGPNYWIMRKIGFLMPAGVAARAACITVHEIVTLFVVTQYMEVYVIRDDLDLVLTNLKISMLSTVCVFKANTFVMWQARWRRVLDYVSAADRRERETGDAASNAVIDTYTAYCRRVTYFYWALVFLTFFTTVAQPVVLWGTSAAMREGVREHTLPFPHIFSSWVPWDKEHAPGCWVTVLWHMVLCAYGGGVMAAYDATVVVVMVFFGGQMDLLRLRARQLPPPPARRAALAHLHRIHVDLIEHLRLFDSLLSPVMFLYMVMCSLMLCTSAYKLTTATDTTQKVLMAEYLIFGVAQLFVFCWHSNDVWYKSMDVFLGPYESTWCCEAGGGDVLLLTGQLRPHCVFSAGPFAKLTLPTFINGRCCPAPVDIPQSPLTIAVGRVGLVQILCWHHKAVCLHISTTITALMPVFVAGLLTSTILKGAYSYYTLLRKP